MWNYLVLRMMNFESFSFLNNRNQFIWTCLKTVPPEDREGAQETVKFNDISLEFYH